MTSKRHDPVMRAGVLRGHGGLEQFRTAQKAFLRKEHVGAIVIDPKST
ncbi:MAG: hypothetical protein OXF41_14105 [bacterium]|nr:hypothetical protein [bacterium]